MVLLYSGQHRVGVYVSVAMPTINTTTSVQRNVNITTRALIWLVIHNQLVMDVASATNFKKKRNLNCCDLRLDESVLMLLPLRLESTATAATKCDRVQLIIVG